MGVLLCIQKCFWLNYKLIAEQWDGPNPLNVRVHFHFLALRWQMIERIIWKMEYIFSCGGRMCCEMRIMVISSWYALRCEECEKMCRGMAGAEERISNTMANIHLIRLLIIFAMNMSLNADGYSQRKYHQARALLFMGRDKKLIRSFVQNVIKQFASARASCVRRAITLHLIYYSSTILTTGFAASRSFSSALLWKCCTILWLCKMSSRQKCH